MTQGIHHSVVLVQDLDQSVRFYRDGLGLQLLVERESEGDWPTLLEAPSNRLRVVFLGDPAVPDISSGVLELAEFVGGETPVRRQMTRPEAGLFLLSFFVEVEATLDRLAVLGLGGTPRRVEQPTPAGPLSIATVRDPDGVLVLLTPGSITQTH